MAELAATTLGTTQPCLHPLPVLSAPLLPSSPWMVFSRQARSVLATVRGVPHVPGTSKL